MEGSLPGGSMEGSTVASSDPWLEPVNAALSDLMELIADAPSQLLEAIKYSLLSPGKRLRPRLVILSCAALGGDPKKAIPAGCAAEMIHSYSLIHDDLPSMDNDDLRRGQPTLHKVFDEATAILAGDALQAFAFQILAQKYPAATGAGCCRELAIGAGAVGMVGGQILDLFWQNRQNGSAEDLQAVHAAKTGALFRACVRIGAWIAQGEIPGGPEPAKLSALTKFGRAFGLLFQITDDLLDVEGESQSAGKRVGKDADRGKLTYPGLFGVDESRRQAHDLCRQAIAAVEPLGQAAAPLQELARAVSHRQR
jgi:geranylgeranyl diphosphate synthase, type II